MTESSEIQRLALAGNAEAQFALASTLLASPDSADSFARGARLVEEAAESGHAEAACMLATLEAVGAGRRQDWNRAFDCLLLAADRGSEHACSQLRLLSQISSQPGAFESGTDAESWRGLRERIRIEQLLGAPERVALSERPRLRAFPGFASAAECKWVMTRLRHKLAPAMVWDEINGSQKVDPVRSNSAVELRLTEMDVVIEVLRARISIATRLPEPIFEIPQVMHYSVGQEFKPHHDFLDPGEIGVAADLASRGQRIGTFLVYLNDDFEGGETEFPRAAISHRARGGDALFFANVTPDGRPDPLTVHAGRPLVKGEKWIFSQWIRDRAPVPPG
jgi:prolyl 4-hydroxylase